MSVEAARILLVDDDEAVIAVLGALLEQAGLAWGSAGTGEEALARLEEGCFDLVISDVRMPGLDGMALLSHVRRTWPGLPVMMLTAHGSIPLAVEATRRGAVDFLEKPFDREGLLFVVHKALALARHAEEHPPVAAPAGAAAREGTGWRSAAMRELDGLLGRAARSSATVLLRGGNGSGKEVAARLIHERSASRAGPFVAVNVAALPETLLESEVFGHEKGAFTGAASRKPGRVELAAGGTLLLDEIGDLPLAMQPKLLRLLEAREYQRVGGTQPLRTDARFIAATHRDLEAMVVAGQFREDLLFRINGLQIRVPDLSERRDDIPVLVAQFVAELGAECGRRALRFEPDALALLAQREWRGNVRQLRNFVERVMVMSDEEAIGARIIERELRRQEDSSTAASLVALGGTPPDGPSAPVAGGPLEAQRREAERAAILDALRRSGNNRSVAARVLGIGRRTLYNKLHELGIE